MLGLNSVCLVSLNKGRAVDAREGQNLPDGAHRRDHCCTRVTSDMLLATHGRSIWILDDISAFQQAPTAMASAAYLFDIRPATSFNLGSFRPPFGSPGDRRFWGKNPDPGAALTYYLRGPAQSITARVTDASGAVVRELGAGDFAGRMGAGVNRIQVRTCATSAVARPRSCQVVAAPGGAGPFVLPGTYRVALSVDGRDAVTKSVIVNGDPLSVITDADRKQWHDLSLAVHQLEGVAGMAAGRIAALSASGRAVQAFVNQAQTPPPAIRTSVDALNRELAALRRQFSVSVPGEAAPSGRGGGGGGGRGGVAPVPNQLSGVKGQLMQSTSRPTETALRTAREARQDLVAAIEAINRIITTTLPAVYQSLGQPQLAPSVTPMPAVTVSIP